MKCPYCEGEGGWTEYHAPGVYEDMDCPTCDGTGSVSIKHRLSIWFWDNIPVEFVEWYGGWRHPIEKELDDG
jgi:hypothetical protein